MSAERLGFNCLGGPQMTSDVEIRSSTRVQVTMEASTRRKLPDQELSESRTRYVTSQTKIKADVLVARYSLLSVAVVSHPSELQLFRPAAH